MALPAPLQALFDRLQTYNSDAYNASSNPGGFARGGNQKPVDNFIKSIRDFTAFGRGISDNVDGSVDAAAASASAAAADRVQTGQDRTATGQDRASAAQSASDAAAQAEKLVGTSATSVTPGTGSRTFTTQAGKYFAVGTFLTIVSTAAPTTRWMAGQVTAYNATTGALTINAQAIGSVTTSAEDWDIYVSGARGAQGDQGVPGVASMPRRQASSSRLITAADSGSLFTAIGSGTQRFDTPENIGSDKYFIFSNTATDEWNLSGVVGTGINPLSGGKVVLVQCNGFNLFGHVLNPSHQRGVGDAQTWQSVSRSANTTYQNTTGRPIVVVARPTSNNLSTCSVSSDNSTFLEVASSNSGGIYYTLVVPSGVYYRFNTVGVEARELR